MVDSSVIDPSDDGQRSAFEELFEQLVQCPGQIPVSRPRSIKFLGPLIEPARSTSASGSR
ncbi:hypothetical protein [Streptomyces sp. 4F14]|uniref:hypothetical protein n=1 Tax=Streptomyces sp. 4F14 TaxID=3394380 RepID=UPI003A88E7E4